MSREGEGGERRERGKGEEEGGEEEGGEEEGGEEALTQSTVC